MPRRQTEDDNKMSLQDYLGLYQMFSPERQVALAGGLEKLNQSRQGEQFAQSQGYPNLTAMDISEKHQEAKDVGQLRQRALQQTTGDKELEGIMHMANLATNVGDMNTAKSALQLLKQRYGIKDQEQPTSDLEKKLKGLYGGKK